MKAIVILALLMIVTGCSAPAINIVKIGADDEDRPLFNVTIDGIVHDNYYAEEIGQSLLDGKWQRNQDLVITESSEFQLFMEEDSIHIYDFGRKVGAIAYDECDRLNDVLDQK